MKKISDLPSDFLQQQALTVLALVCRGYLSETLLALDRLENSNDKEALHDFRVGLRRLRSTLTVYRASTFTANKNYKKILKSIKRIARASNGARDHEVALDWVRSHSKELKPEQQEQCALFMEKLKESKKEEYEISIQEIEEKALWLRKKLPLKLENILSTETPTAGEAFAAVFEALVREHADSLASCLKQIQSLHDSEKSHLARLQAKRLRYLIEPFKKHIPETAPLVATLKNLQDILGELNDIHVLSQLLTSYTERHATGFTRDQLDCLLKETPVNNSNSDLENELSSLLALGQLMSDRRTVLFSEFQNHWLKENQAFFFSQLQQWRNKELMPYAA